MSLKEELNIQSETLSDSEKSEYCTCCLRLFIDIRFNILYIETRKSQSSFNFHHRSVQFYQIIAWSVVFCTHSALQSFFLRSKLQSLDGHGIPSRTGPLTLVDRHGKLAVVNRSAQCVMILSYLQNPINCVFCGLVFSVVKVI